MIWKCIAIIATVIVLEFLVAWLKALTDESDKTDYEYCHGCHNGFCMEIPKTKGCTKWEREQDKCTNA